MTFNIWFDLCAVFMLVIILVAFYTKNSIPIVQNKIFALLAWLVLISTFCDMMTGISQNMQGAPIAHDLYYYILQLLNYGYFISRNATPFIYLIYIMAVLNISEKFSLRSLYLYLPAVADLILIALTPFTNFVFSVDRNGMYHRGPLLPVLYAMAVYYLVLAVWLVIYYRSVIPLSRRISFHAFVVIALGTVCIQGVFPYLMVECYGSTLCILLIYLTIQRPDEVLDGASGLLNKTAFLTMLSIHLRKKSRFAVFLIAIDDFSIFEKSLGIHVMQGLASAVSSYLRQFSKTAGIYRISDDRFCLLLLRPDPTVARELLRVVSARFSEAWEADGLTLSLKVRYGLIRCPEHADSPEKLLDLIDLIPEEARKRNLSYIAVSERDIMEKHTRQKISGVVQRALQENLFEVVYQPIFSPKQNRFVSAEALLRLRDPEMGSIPPDEFIPIAEKNGLIVKIGQFVLESVCRFIREKDLPGLGLDYVEVNLSIMECLQDNLVENVLRPLEKYGLNPDRINLEITETAANTLPETVDCNLRELAGRGIRFSLDDYGTGYSNISRMLELPLDIIKVDKSIVQRAFTSESANIVLTSTFQMLQKLDKHILAEGVETREQAEYLIQLGCHYIQGYYYARPMPAQDFLLFLEKHQEMEAVPCPQH